MQTQHRLKDTLRVPTGTVVVPSCKVVLSTRFNDNVNLLASDVKEDQNIRRSRKEKEAILEL